MHNRLALLFKGLCLLFGALMLVQLSRLAVWQNPLAGTVIPKVPAAASTNAPAENSQANSAASENASMVNSTSTNRANAIPTNALTTATNIPSPTNLITTNLATAKASATNVGVTTGVSSSTNLSGPKSATNANSREMAGNSATNSPASSDTNAAHGSIAARNSRPNTAPPGVPPPPSARASMPSGRGMPGGMDMGLPLMVQARIEQIIKSEILGMIMRPPPMALLGIAGKDVLFRSPTGQTGLMRVGEEMGGVKLLQIGSNRILIEQDGQKKELTIFEGLGGESLMPK